MKVKLLSKITALTLVIALCCCFFMACRGNGGGDVTPPLDETLKGIDDEKDLSAVVSGDKDLIIDNANYESVGDMRNKLILKFVSGKEVKDGYKIAADVHPKLIATETDLANIRKNLETDVQLKKFYSVLKKKADKAVSYETPYYGSSTSPLNGSADGDPARITSLHGQTYELADAAFYYTLNADRENPDKQAVYKYKTQTLDNVLQFCNPAMYPDWGIGGANHQLDAGVAAGNISIYYDIMYPYLNQTDRSTIKNALIRYVIGNSSDKYMAAIGAGTDLTKAVRNEVLPGANASWYNGSNNWNAICNGGAITAALAVSEGELTDLYACMIAKGFNNMSYLMKTYYPGGNSEEGFMYWEYAWMFLDIVYRSVIKTASPDAFSWMSSAVMSDCAKAPFLSNGSVIGPSVGDDPVKGDKGNIRLFLADYFDMADVQAYHVKNVNEDKTTWREMIYYSPERAGEETGGGAPPDDRFVRNIENVVLSAGDAKKDLYTSIHVGPNNASHGHLDAGQFDLQGNGIPFVYGSLGRDDYNKVPGYFNNKNVKPAYTETDPDVMGKQESAYSWHVYRMRTESKSAVVIKPRGIREDIRQEQSDAGNPKVERLLSRDKGGFTIVDLSDCYDRDVTSYKRGIKLRRDLNMTTLQDEIKLKSDVPLSAKIIWSVNINAGAEITLVNNNRGALISVASEVMYVELASDVEGAEFSITEQTYLTGEQFPLTKNQETNNGKKLAVVLSGARDYTLAVNFVMLNKWQYKPDFVRPAVKSMADWNIPTGEIPAKPELPTASEIKIDGKSIDGFDPNKNEYEFEIPLEQKADPIITAVCDRGSVIKTDVRGKKWGFVHVTNGDATRTYEIRFNVSSQPVTATNLNDKIVSCIASSEPEASLGNVAACAYDGDITTKWAAQGVQDITFTLDGEYEIGYVALMLGSSFKRVATFNVEISTDGIEWKRVREADNFLTNGVTSEDAYEAFAFATPIKGKYFKLISYGNSSSGWISLLEIKIFGSAA